MIVVLTQYRILTNCSSILHTCMCYRSLLSLQYEANVVARWCK